MRRQTKNNPIPKDLDIARTAEHTGSGQRTLEEVRRVAVERGTQYESAENKMSEAEVASQISQRVGIPQEVAWRCQRQLIDLILTHVYNEAREAVVDGQEFRFDAVLYTTLNETGMPEGTSPEDLAALGETDVESAQRFLNGLRALFTEVERPSEPLGWFLFHSGRPLVLLWDHFLPYARMQRRWQEGEKATIEAITPKWNANGTEGLPLVRLFIYRNPKIPDSQSRYIDYQPQSAEELETLWVNQAVRYWEQGEDGNPVVYSELPLSPFAAERRKSGVLIDESQYTLMPLTVG